MADKISYYKKNYAPPLKLMTDRHGQRDFAKADHEVYQKVKNFMEPALENLILTADDCECLLSIFEMIAGLREKIENKEFYRLWNLAITFRKNEHRDLYTSFLENLQQLKIYRESKKIAFKISVPKTYKKSSINIAKTNEKAIAKALDGLIAAIKKITEILTREDENTSYLANVSLLKGAQLREEQIQATIIEREVRKPIEYNPHELFRRSQSFHKSGISENDLTEEVNITRSRKMSM